jgi:outer membrane protein assembly factor BamB
MRQMQTRASQKYLSFILAHFSLLFLLGSILSAGADDWPQWRGPNRDGICAETGLLKQWPSGGPRLAWKAQGLGNGYSTLAVVGERIFTVGETGDSSSVIALNAADGQLKWSAKLGKAGAMGGYIGPRGAPTVDGELVFALGQFGELACFEVSTGKERWRKHLVKDFGGTSPNWGFAESPLIDGGKVMVTPGGSDGTVAAMDRNTGALAWRSKEWTDLPHYSSLIVADIGGVRQYVQLTAEHVAGVAAADGKLLWKASRRGQTAVIPTPIYHDGFVYVTSGYGIGCNLFKIVANSGKFGAEQVYANKVMANHHGGVIRIGDFLYGHSDGKGWTCQDFKTGQARWQEKKLGKGSLTYADGHFYLREENKGTVALIEATADAYKEHGRFEQPGRSDKNAWSHPVIAGGRLYLRDQDLLLCYEVKELGERR